MLLLFIIGTTIALALGVWWALSATIPPRLEAFIVDLSGGALLIAAVLELIQPVLAERDSALTVFVFLLAGGGVYSVLLFALEHSRWTDQAGGVIATMWLNGVPENLAVGITLIDHSHMHVMALLGSIFLSNVPEAAGASKDLISRGYRQTQIVRTWLLVLAVLAIAPVLGYYGLSRTDPELLGYLRCFAAGAIISSLAVDVFPKAFKADHRLTGVATVLGVVLALSLNRLG